MAAPTFEFGHVPEKLLDFFDEDMPKSLIVSLCQIIWAHVTGSALNGILSHNK